MPEAENLSTDQLLIQASTESANTLRSLDIHLGRFLAGLSPGQSDEVLLATTLTSAATGQGHSCLPLAQASCVAPSLPAERLDLFKHGESKLYHSPIIGRAGELTPLILDQQCLYLYRYYRYETDIALALQQRARTRPEIDQLKARTALEKLTEIGGLDAGQQHAAALALIKPLLIVSGGPGTGKTYTLAYTLALLQMLSPRPLKIALAAPTGKAAARMAAAIQSAKTSMPDDYAKHIPDEAQTLHRLLGLRPGADDFSYNATRPLPIDLLVVDEASMIDLVMMDGLLRALPDPCRLILMGDHHQLPSVDAGNVFADLCSESGIQHSEATREFLLAVGIDSERTGSLTSSRNIQDCYSRLRTNHRQKDAANLSALSQAIDRADMPKIERLRSEGHPDVEICYPEDIARTDWLEGKILAHYAALFTAPSMEQAFDIMEKCRFLCALREGVTGVEGVNRYAEQLLRREGLIHTTQEYYRGKPIIIRHNQYRLRLFNGDSGILWEDDQGEMKAWFKNQDNSFRALPVIRLPAFDCAYAITIHQAQGSEFEHVVMLLPEESNRLLSRELIYTGITRARRNFALFGERKIMESAISRQTQRYSGLRNRLQQPETEARN